MATAPELLPYERIRADLFRPLSGISRRYILATIAAFIVGAAGLGAWAYQLYRGMGVTGLHRPVFWGFYLVDFVFWIGISHAGTLISAILRLTNATWRKPVTRAAEAITVFALMIGGMFPIIHLGRAWLFFWLFPYPNSRLLWPNFRSPLLWDVTAISTYLTGSVIYLYLPLIPDLAQLGEQHISPFRRKLYRILSLGWVGNDRQWHALERAMKLRPASSWQWRFRCTRSWPGTSPWPSPRCGTAPSSDPYFVSGAIFSGIAALILAMASLRKLLHLEGYLTQHHFNQLLEAAAADEPAVGLLHLRREPDRLVRQ